MNGLMGMLQKRIGGLPAWGWALIIAGVIVGYAYLTRSGDDGPTPAPVAPPYPDDDLPSDAGDIPGEPQSPPKDNEIQITTNPAWIRYVTDRLVAEGLYGAVEVTNALTKVLGGIDVTEQEAAIYNLAVRRFGAPPEGAPPIKVIPKPKPPTTTPPKPPPSTNPPPAKPPAKPPPKPTPKPPPKPAPAVYVPVRVVKYTTKNPPWNSTMWGIAKHYGYGSGKNNYVPIWNDAKNASLRKKRGTPTRIQPGDIVYVKRK